jgi:hypothetical protein
VVGGVGAALMIDVFAGMHPALRASRLSPTEALNGFRVHFLRMWRLSDSASQKGNKNLVDDFGHLVVADGAGTPCLYQEHAGSD